MQGLRWDEVRSFFDPDQMGALPDVFVPAASAEDWQSVFDLVETRGWRWEFRQGATASPPPHVGRGDRLRHRSAGLRGQAGVDTLCGFLAEIGRELRKPVLMTPEGGSQAHPVLGFDPTLDRVVSMADPPSGS
ncbi:hypothetical protein DL991_21090 [Amycolatopsis sp. WAC 01375]|nr:hypothetical protein DL991_21090 [Amycolatopsis sp. WAC 01375]